MATRKKAKVKRKKTTAKRPAIRKKASKVAKKPARKTPIRRTAAKAARRKPAPRKAARPATPQPPPAPGERIGVVIHYYGNVSVAIVKLEPGITLRVGDNIHIRGHTSDFGQRVDSLQIGHAPVSAVGPNDDFGLKVAAHAREHDIVYRVK
jgi:putative protease